MTEKILLTGFGPFGSVARNISSDAVRRFDGAERAGFEIQTLTLPVQLERAVAALEEVLAADRPAAVIACGIHQDDPPVGFRLELAAKNERHYEIPDDDGQLIQGEPVEADGPPMVFGTLPVGEIKQRLEEQGLRVQLSEDAGRYLCNAVFYWLARRVTPAGFLHVPSEADGLEDVVRAIDIAVGVTAERLAAQQVEATA